MHRISVVILSIWLRSYAQGCKSASSYGGSGQKTSLKHSWFSGCSERLFRLSESYFSESCFVGFVCFLVFILLFFFVGGERDVLFCIEKCGETEWGR